jgi:enamine deaminase RidA (YjgF/YER057c/UK114 family)
MRLALITMFAALNGTTLSAQAEFLKPKELSPANGYSHVVVTSPGRLAFISGQVANDSRGNLVGKGDLKAQADQVFRNLSRALSATGASFQDVVKITWYVRDYKPESLAVLREVRNRYVNSAAPPASTLVGVASLFQPDYLLEVEAVATIPEKRAKQ